MIRLHSGAEPDRRRAERLPASASPSANPRQLVDISPFGCGLELDEAEDYQPGQFAELTFGETVVLRAIVRWAGERRLGLEFTRALTSDTMAAIRTSDEAIGFVRV